SVPAGRRLDWSRPYVRVVCRRRPSATLLHARARIRRSGYRYHRQVRGEVLARNGSHAYLGGTRVTKPYTDEEWRAIDQLGDHVDADLAARDVRLALGGEPTFVSIDDPDGEEWNTAALGPDKRRLATDLYHRLRKRYGVQGLVHFGQGKWYPGEQLPRWSLNCFWRADGEPIWRHESLIAD